MLGMLRIAAMLHDVGKVTVPDAILCKPGALTAEEFELIKGHSVAGAELVSRVEGLDDDRRPGSATRTRASTAPAIPTAFAARRSRRPRGSCSSPTPSTRSPAPAPTARRCSVEHACEELERHAGTQFDPACVEALLAQPRGAERAAPPGRRSAVA